MYKGGGGGDGWNELMRLECVIPLAPPVHITPHPSPSHTPLPSLSTPLHPASLIPPPSSNNRLLKPCLLTPHTPNQSITSTSYPRYCSGQWDVDGFFGSLGPFHLFEPLEGALRSYVVRLFCRCHCHCFFRRLMFVTHDWRGGPRDVHVWRAGAAVAWLVIHCNIFVI